MKTLSSLAIVETGATIKGGQLVHSNMRVGTNLPKEVVFVFGSNEGGLHEGGAARTAFDIFGAVWGQATGMQGQSYAIPTLNENFGKIPLYSIYGYICEFLKFALTSDKFFFVSEIGCGIAGYNKADIAKLFNDAIKEVGTTGNLILPVDFVGGAQ